jgi:hypothetical protein
VIRQRPAHRHVRRGAHAVPAAGAQVPTAG